MFQACHKIKNRIQRAAKMSQKTVVIIGAGISGLATIKSCLEYGLKPVCFEMKPELGGAWAPIHPRPKDYNAGQVYDDHYTNNCKYQFVYSDFPHPKETPLNIPREHVLNYLRSYASHFELAPYIKLKTKVLAVKKAEDYVDTGRWIVTTCPHSVAYGEADETSVVTVADAVVICCGDLSRERLPEMANRTAFRNGTVIHSADFWNSDPYRDRRVAIVGAGVSGIHLATLLAANKTAQVYLLASRGTWITPLFYKGRHFEYTTMDYRLNFEHPDPEAVRSALVESAHWRFDHDALGIRSAGKMLSTSASFAINNDIDQWISSGRIQVIRDGATGFTENGLQLKEGGVLEVDDVIYTTGYRTVYPFIDEPQLLNEERPHEGSYLYLCPIEQHRPTLFTIVTMYILQAAPGISELMARAACAVISGARPLPSKIAMREWLEETRQQQISFCGVYPGIVMFHPLRDDLSQLIGCRPDMKEIGDRDAELAEVLQEGSVTPFVYRLLGPHANWQIAHDAIIEAERYGKRKISVASATK